MSYNEKICHINEVAALAKILQGWGRENLMNMLKKLLVGVVVSAAVLAGAVCCSNGDESKAAGEDTEESDDNTGTTDGESHRASSS
jgi:hypothetical protein